MPKIPYSRNGASHSRHVFQQQLMYSKLSPASMARGPSATWIYLLSSWHLTLTTTIKKRGYLKTFYKRLSQAHELFLNFNCRTELWVLKVIWSLQESLTCVLGGYMDQLLWAMKIYSLKNFRFFLVARNGY